MNPDSQHDWLDRALKARPAMRPASGFTRTVLDRVAASEPGRVSTFVAEEGVRLGLAIAAAGVLSVADVDEIGWVLGRVVNTTDAALVTAVTLGLTWFVLSRRTAKA